VSVMRKNLSTCAFSGRGSWSLICLYYSFSSNLYNIVRIYTTSSRSLRKRLEDRIPPPSGADGRAASVGKKNWSRVGLMRFFSPSTAQWFWSCLTGPKLRLTRSELFKPGRAGVDFLMREEATRDRVKVEWFANLMMTKQSNQYAMMCLNVYRCRIVSTAF